MPISTARLNKVNVVHRAQTAKRLQGWQSGLMREPAKTTFQSCIKRTGQARTKVMQ